LSLLGTFLVRSGVLTSVHAFASDPTRGVYILAFLGVVIGGSLVLFAVRGPRTLGGSRFDWLSRETMLLANNVLLIVSTATVLLGTLYPLVIDALGAGKLSVGPPYFNAVFVPLMVVLLALLGLGQLVRYKRDQAERLVRHMGYGAGAALVLGVGMAIMLGGELGTRAAVGLSIALAAWVAVGSIQAIRTQMSPHRSRASALRRLPAGVYGMALAHLGLAVTVVGVALSSGYAVEERLRMAPGDRAEVAGYSFRFQGVEQRQGPNYQASTATFTITHGGSPVAQLTPEKRRYASGGQPMTEAGIDAGVTRDLYASLGEPLGDGAWSVRLYHKPFVRWIWLGALLMAAGGVLAVADRRYRSRGERVPARTLARGAQRA